MKKPGKEKNLVIWGTILVLIVPGTCALAVVGIGMSMNDVEIRDLKQVDEPAPIVTLAEFERIRTSMSYQEVVEIIDGPGIAATPSSELKNDSVVFETRVYVWQNSDFSNMRATFQQDRLVTKTQLYLK